MIGWSLILLISYGIIFTLILAVIFLSLRLLKLKRRNDQYQKSLERQQIILPECRSKISVNFACHSDNDNALKKSSTSNSLGIRGDGTKSQGESPDERDFPRRELLSPQELNGTGSSGLSGSRADLLLQINGGVEAKESKLREHNKEVPAIDFKLVYGSHNLALRVHINRVSNLPVQFRKKCASYVKITLINKSEKLSSHQTSIIKKSLNPQYEEGCTFSAYQFEELKKFTIRFSVYAKKKQLSKRQLVGDLYVPLSRPDFEADSELVCFERLSLACLQTGKRGPLIMAGELGFLLVHLQYQPEAERLKVFIRKAQNIFNKSFHSNNFELKIPEYYVVVNLMNFNETIEYKETKPMMGSSPVWNQPFLFNIPKVGSNNYWLQFLLMKDKLYSRDGAVGHVLVGSNTTQAGIAHWDEILKPEFNEVAKWHEICHIGTFCF